MIAEVIPALRLPPERSAFDYAVPPGLNLAPADLVVVPFRSRLVPGVVRTVKDRSAQSGPLKIVTERIDGVRFDLPLLEWAAAAYGAGLPLALFTFLPSMPKRPDERHVTDIAPRSLNSEGRVDALPAFSIFTTPAERLAAHVNIVKMVNGAGRQALILAPEDADLRFLADGLRREVPDLVTFSGSLGIRDAWRALLSFARGRAPLLIGTRLAALAPAAALGAVLLDRDEDPSHKQSDAHPRYDARELARRRAAAGGIPLSVVTESPRVECFSEDPSIAIPSAGAAPIIVDLHGSWKSGEKGLISGTLAEAAAAARQAGKISLLFHNRKGLGGIVTCRDCREIVRCESCSRPMAAERGGLICRNCETVRDAPLFCRNCRGQNIAVRKLGVTRIAEEISKRMPGIAVAEIARRARGERPPPLPAADVVVGTEVLLHWYRNELFGLNVGAVGVVLADVLWQKPEYVSNEEALASLTSLRNVASASGAPFLVQTIDPGHRVIGALTGNPGEFYGAELEDRAALSFPPHSILIKLTSRTLAPESPETARLAADLRALGAQVSVVPSRRPSVRWRTLIAVKIPPTDDQRFRALSRIEPGWTVEVNPRSLFD